MSLRKSVMTCLRERVLNQTEGGRVFEKDEDYLTWLVGSDAEGVKGFLGNPSEALSQNIVRASGNSPHEGVSLSADESESIGRVIAGLNFGGPSTRPFSGSIGSLMKAATFVGPILAGGY